VLNLEEPALFNEAVERFIALVEANCWAGAIRGRRWPQDAVERSRDAL
jgi:hypothetical protein